MLLQTLDERCSLVAAASATPVAAATTAAAAASTTTTAATATAVFTRTGFVDSQGSPLVLLFVEPLDGRLCFGIAAHFHKSKALAAARFAVLNDLSTLHCAKLTEQLF